MSCRHILSYPNSILPSEVKILTVPIKVWNRRYLVKDLMLRHLIQICIIQGGSNMTGTDLCVNKPRMSRSYLNHLGCKDYKHIYMTDVEWDLLHQKSQFVSEWIRTLTVSKIITVLIIILWEPGSVVGTATGYGLDGPGIESWWGRDYPRTCPDQHWGPPSLLYNGYRVFPRGKERPGRDADPSPPSSAVVMKGYRYTSTPTMGCTACTEPQCMYKGALYFTFNL